MERRRRQARLELLAGIAALLGGLPDVFDAADMRLVFGWLTSFVCNPWSATDTNAAWGGATPLSCAAPTAH